MRQQAPFSPSTAEKKSVVVREPQKLTKVKVASPLPPPFPPSVSCVCVCRGGGAGKPPAAFAIWPKGTRKSYTPNAHVSRPFCVNTCRPQSEKKVLVCNSCLRSVMRTKTTFLFFFLKRFHSISSRT